MIKKMEIRVVEQGASGRLDHFITEYFNHHSRSYVQRLIRDGHVTVNGKQVVKSSLPIKPGDSVAVAEPPPVVLPDPREMPVDLGVQVLHEHPDFIAVYKPAGLIVHVPEQGFPGITLVDWLIAHFHGLSTLGPTDRPGIVHRLDMHTSGVLLVARTNRGHAQLAAHFKDRTIHKTYLALVTGHPDAQGSIDLPIMRHPVNRNRMTCVKPGDPLHGRTARESLTHYKVLQYFDDYSLVEVKPVTGRTHQIRVHFAAIGHPLVGDPVYGKKSKLIDRQALHAREIAFTYEGQEFCIQAEMPEDMQALITQAS